MMPVANKNDILFDVGNLAVALCFQQKVFLDHSTIKSVLAETEHILQFAPEVLEMPFFHAKIFGDWSVNVNKALAARGTSEMLCKLCEIVGFDGKIMLQDY
jgi:hypothetical protein